MSRSRGRPQTVPREWLGAISDLRQDRLFGRIEPVRFYDVRDNTHIPNGVWAIVTRWGDVYCNTRMRGSRDEWAYALAHCVLHVCLGHFRRHDDHRVWNYACDAVVTRFLDAIRFGSAPQEYRVDYPALGGDEEAIYQELVLRGGVPDDYAGDLASVEHERSYADPADYPAIFTRALRDAVGEAVRIASGVAPVDVWSEARAGSAADDARSWFMRSYPLLGALAAGFKIIEDADACRAMDIRVAAVSASAKEIYINPAAGLDEQEMRFVMAHEILHAALRHDQREEQRDPYLWNVACDYQINLWLQEMGIGAMPGGLLLDPQLRGLSSEEIYDRIARNLRLQRRLRRSATFAGTGKPDIVGRRPDEWWLRGEGLTLDEYYRSALAQGLDLHVDRGRGLLPAGLVEEIRAQAMPPIPWDVQLAQWLDQFFPIPEYRRTYARPSRRQASTPDIPRPRVVPVDGWDEARTFGLVLDTSGSMTPTELARGLGTVGSYCASREIPAVRVVFCDASAYDAGYLTADAIAGRVRVRGGGGTILQPGIDLLQGAADFPADGPILVVTDAYCEPNLHVRREHAYLIPKGSRLPFPPRGPVFTMPPDRREQGA